MEKCCIKCFINRDRLRGTRVGNKCHHFRQGALVVEPCLADDALQQEAETAVCRAALAVVGFFERHPELVAVNTDAA